MKQNSIKFLIAMSTFLTIGTWAFVSQQISYNGHLTDAGGNPEDGVFTFTFYLYDAAVDGELLWNETQDNVTVNQGVFHVKLGDVNPIDLPFDEIYWLELEVNGEALSPRQQLTSVGQAFNAADNLGEDIHPSSISITGYGQIVDDEGHWVGEPTGLIGPTGPQGDTGSMGPEGPQGDPGPQGATGVEGPMGPSGPSGQDGAAGPAGPSGPMGATGPEGEQGPPGERGATGPEGEQGPPGLRGATGPEGPPGQRGATGPIGPTGPSGPRGPSGPDGIDGARGPSGPGGPSGPSGPAGAAGSRGPSGPQGDGLSCGGTLSCSGRCWTYSSGSSSEALRCLNSNNAGIYSSGGSYGMIAQGNYGVFGCGNFAGVLGLGEMHWSEGVYGSAYGEESSGVLGCAEWRGVSGEGDDWGVFGYSIQYDGVGVEGRAPNNTGVIGSGNIGLKGIGSDTAVSAEGGTFGIYASGTSYGIRSYSANKYGIYGYGGSYGVYGCANIYGLYGGAGATGVYGTGANRGVYGSSSTGEGVYGEGGAYGVYGYAPSDGYAGRFVGNTWFDPHDTGYHIFIYSENGEPSIYCTQPNYGYVGTSNFYWYYMCSSNFYDVGKSDKKDVTLLEPATDLGELIMKDIDGMQPILFRNESEINENSEKYRPQMNLNIDHDTVPAYLKDKDLAGVNIASLASLGIAGVKNNRRDIEKMKETVTDFGSVSMDKNEIWVPFSDQFAAKLNRQNLPVITATPYAPNAELYIAEKTTEGFMLISESLRLGFNVDWHASARCRNETLDIRKRFPAEMLHKLYLHE